MAEVIEMPKLSDTMTEGVIASWSVEVGDEVDAGEVLAEIETDKATMELESYFDGVVLHLEGEAGDAVPLGNLLAIIGEEGEDVSDLVEKHRKQDKEGGGEEASDGGDSDSPGAEQEASSGGGESAGGAGSAPDVVPEKVGGGGTQTASAEGASKSQASGDSTTEGGRIKASPLAKKMAEENGIDLGQLQGSGEGGRIVRRDIEAAIEKGTGTAAPAAAPQPAPQQQAAPAAPPTPPEGAQYEEVRVSQMRKTIARRLGESKFSAPHFYLTMPIDMSGAMKFRKELNAQLEAEGLKVSFNDIIIKAASMALIKHPKVNANWLGDKIRYNHFVNMGVAVAVEEGLVVPVVRNAHAKGISAIGAEVRDLAGKARDKKLQPEEMEGNTFTISNLGMFGIEEFTAIINPPDACILAIGAIQEEPVVKNGQLTAGHRMRITLSCDHRVVDGATGSEFLQTLRGMLENPMTMLI